MDIKGVPNWRSRPISGSGENSVRNVKKGPNFEISLDLKIRDQNTLNKENK
jgi:hypothetical protein